jgi:glutathione S-transferase
LSVCVLPAGAERKQLIAVRLLASDIITERTVTSPLNLASSLLASSAALWRGTNAKPAARTPALPLKLYEMENCPYCRLVREALTELDLDALILPCPKGGKRYRDEAVAAGGKAQFPYLVDENTKTSLYESLDIIDYLYETYGRRAASSRLKMSLLATPSSMLASGLRLSQGLRARPALPTDKPLALWCFESSPYARPVRELLCELELPYMLHNIGKGQWQDFALTKMRDRLWPEMAHASSNRQALKRRAGKVMSPYFEDPNTGAAMFESADIRDYLLETYATQ